MDGRKIFRRAVFVMLVAFMISAPIIAHAEVKTYTGEGRYIMSEVENLGVAKERAKADAMRNASEQAGVYVKSYSRTKNLALEEDVIETMTANILKLVEEPHFYPLETVDNLEGVLIRVTVKVQIDDSDINRWLNKDDREKSTLVSQMKALRRANAEQEKQIAELKRQLAQMTTEQDKERIAEDFADEDKIFLSNQKAEEGWKLWDKGDYNGAKNLFDEAIELNPNNAEAWYGRGTSYGNSGQYERAVEDFDKSIQLNPNFALAYYNRGTSYGNLRQFRLTIRDLDKAIQLNPNYAEAYYNRGLAYGNLKQYERAIQDLNKAIQRNPNFALAHYIRGLAYGSLGQYERVIADATKAIQLNPNDADAYKLRGAAYQALGQTAKAQADFAKAKQLGYNG